MGPSPRRTTRRQAGSGPAPKPVARQPRRPTTKRSINPIRADVFQFKNGGHNSVFMATRNGIVVVDPVNRAAASWLNSELWRRFNQPVKYAIYSHDHGDHISGGEVFADSAIFISHVKAKMDIIAERRATPVPDVTFT